MKPRFVMSLVSAGLLALASVAPLAAQGSDMKITVPFAFVADGQQLNAGTYYVQRLNQAGLILIHSRTGQAASVITESTGNYNAVDRQPGFSFQRDEQGAEVLTRVQLFDEPAMLLNHPTELPDSAAPVAAHHGSPSGR